MSCFNSDLKEKTKYIRR